MKEEKLFFWTCKNIRGLTPSPPDSYRDGEGWGEVQK